MVTGVSWGNIPIEARWLTDRLAGLRRSFEAACSGPLAEVEVPVVLLLDDVCSALGLPDEARRAVLGEQGIVAVESILGQTCSLRLPEQVAVAASGPVG